MRIIPQGMRFWEDGGDVEELMSIKDIVSKYEAGYAGCWSDPDSKAEFRAYIQSQGFSYLGIDNAYRFGWAGDAAGKLIIPFVFNDRVFPGCMPGPAQARGDCVSHGAKNAALLTLCCEIVAGKPDEVSGKLEGTPEISAEGIRQGVLSTEAIYWWRRHGGDGWSCSSAASVVCKESGMWIRKNYSDLNIDLTKYSGSLAGKWGSRTPPEEIKKVGQEHLIRTSTELHSFEEIRDYLANGYGINSCGGEGFSNTRDENGVARRSGSWAHSMAYIGADDRKETKDKYGSPLVLVMNSWGKWNSGPRQILGTTENIPEGSFWAKWNDLKNRDQYAFSSAMGWPSQKLPDYGFNNYL